MIFRIIKHFFALIDHHKERAVFTKTYFFIIAASLALTGCSSTYTEQAKVMSNYELCFVSGYGNETPTYVDAMQSEIDDRIKASELEQNVCAQDRQYGEMTRYAVEKQIGEKIAYF